MNILVIGDLHGRSTWMNILNKEFGNYDLAIFLGDYVSTHDESISDKDQIDNLDSLLEYKECHPDRLILLRGNHDMQHLGYSWAECSNLSRKVMGHMMNIRDRFLSNTQWIYKYNNMLFSHAGVSSVWLNDVLKCELDEVNNKEPEVRFGFYPDRAHDYIGISPTQPCTWIRPQALIKNLIPDYIQVVGHTTTNDPFIFGKDIILCDLLNYGSYVKIQDGNPILKVI